MLRFLAERRAELAGLIVQHLVLVLVSTAVAVAIGVPARHRCSRGSRAWRAPVLAVAGLLQTIPSLALFGFLIPLPFVGGIGARTAIVALVLYALLPDPAQHLHRHPAGGPGGGRRPPPDSA